MSYITASLLTTEFQRLFREQFPDVDMPKVYIHDRDDDRPRHPFTAHIGDEEIKFTVPEDRLHSSPLAFVSWNYLKPVLSRAAATSIAMQE